MKPLSKPTMLLAAAVMIPAAVFAGGWLSATTDELDQELRDNGFMRIRPQSTLLELGSLYYTDRAMKFFRPACRAAASATQGIIRASDGYGLETERLANRSFSVSFHVSPTSGKGGADNVQHMKLRLRDVKIYEIDERNVKYIQQQLMADELCDNVVYDLVERGYYVCQGQVIINATAEYMFDNKDSTSVDTAAKEQIKTAIEAQTENHADLQERYNGFQTGSKLNYGVVMSPLCIAPKNAMFKRELPLSPAQKIANYVKFDLIEPIFASREDASATAKPAVRNASMAVQ